MGTIPGEQLMVGKYITLILFSCFIIASGGCSRSPDNQTTAPRPTVARVDSSPPTPELLSALKNLSELIVSDTDGQSTDLSRYAEQQTLVLVFSRGYFGSICPFCSTQMHALADSHAEFEKRNATVVVVFPVSQADDKDRWKDLEASILERLPSGRIVPFPILIDVDLKAVDRLGIREALSKPSTFIIDPSKNLRYKYVGSDPADRPDVQTILQQLDGISKS
jgi:peroxiredoxin